jgi:uncharacterized membrane protein
MTRAEFLTRLRRGLNGLPPETIDEIVADHEAHFVEAQAEGRAEAEIAAALGNPERLAREVRAEAGLARWEADKTPGNAVAALVALIGLASIDILFLLPLLVGVVSSLTAIFVAGIGVFFAGGVVFVAGPFAAPPGGPLVAILAGVGVMALGVLMCAVMAVLTVWLVNFLVWFGRLHYRLLKPALQQSNAGDI